MQVGAQLYTVRTYTQNEKDLAFTLKQVAQMGYRTVQISAVGRNIPAKTIKKLCDDCGLSIVLTHTDVERMLGDIDGVIEDHEIMDCPYIGIGAMPERYRNKEWVDHFVEDFKGVARAVAASGRLLMYHNHDLEFEKYDGKRIMDILLEGFTPEEMGITLDTYWVQAAGGDVCQWIRKLKDRIPCVHLKDMAVVGHTPVMAPVLEGNMNFHGILEELKGSNCKYLLVEQDTCIGSPFDCLRQSYENLKKLGYQ